MEYLYGHSSHIHTLWSATRKIGLVLRFGQQKGSCSAWVLNTNQCRRALAPLYRHNLHRRHIARCRGGFTHVHGTSSESSITCSDSDVFAVLGGNWSTASIRICLPTLGYLQSAPLSLSPFSRITGRVARSDQALVLMGYNRSTVAIIYVFSFLILLL